MGKIFEKIKREKDADNLGADLDFDIKRKSGWIFSHKKFVGKTKKSVTLKSKKEAFPMNNLNKKNASVLMPSNGTKLKYPSFIDIIPSSL